MTAIDITNHLFIQALSAIDSGRTNDLLNLINNNPWLVQKRIENQEKGYFKDPYLLWFVAGNPIRTDTLPDNILHLTSELVQAVKRYAPDTYPYQIDYVLKLVVSSRIMLECQVQIKMIDLLIDAGALPTGAMLALSSGNLEAAAHIAERGDKLTLALAVCLERLDDINTLAVSAAPAEKLTAVVAAAYYGKENMIRHLLDMNFNSNGFPEEAAGFHTHATALHQAVSSGSLACVKLLAESGAKLDVRDKIYNGTPLEWAVHLRSESDDEEQKRNFTLIESYLRSKG